MPWMPTNFSYIAPHWIINESMSQLTASKTTRPAILKNKLETFPSAPHMISFKAIFSGLKYRDTFDETPQVQEAVRRLPQHVQDERIFRTVRALQLSMQKTILPKEEWTMFEEIAHPILLQSIIKTHLILCVLSRTTFTWSRNWRRSSVRKPSERNGRQSEEEIRAQFISMGNR